mmetsp:Transcript_13928/g.58599  ORF Transcript_13928/g.58599 Transcript_13928/m.58599 type:complete len:306 (-) Transcript_13928:1695-2612(-)
MGRAGFPPHRRARVRLRDGGDVPARAPRPKPSAEAGSGPHGDRRRRHGVRRVPRGVAHGRGRGGGHPGLPRRRGRVIPVLRAPRGFGPRVSSQSASRDASEKRKAAGARRRRRRPGGLAPRRGARQGGGLAAGRRAGVPAQVHHHGPGRAHGGGAGREPVARRRGMRVERHHRAQRGARADGRDEHSRRDGARRGDGRLLARRRDGGFGGRGRGCRGGGLGGGVRPERRLRSSAVGDSAVPRRAPRRRRRVTRRSIAAARGMKDVLDGRASTSRRRRREGFSLLRYQRRDHHRFVTSPSSTSVVS